MLEELLGILLPRPGPARWLDELLLGRVVLALELLRMLGDELLAVLLLTLGLARRLDELLLGIVFAPELLRLFDDTPFEILRLFAETALVLT